MEHSAVSESLVELFRHFGQHAMRDRGGSMDTTCSRCVAASLIATLALAMKEPVTPGHVAEFGRAAGMLLDHLRHESGVTNTFGAQAEA